MTEGAELTEVQIEQKLHITLYMAEDEVAGEWRLDSNWWNQQKSGYLDGTGEMYDRGFLKINAVDLY